MTVSLEPPDTSEQVECREEITNGSAAVGGYAAGRWNREDTKQICLNKTHINKLKCIVKFETAADLK